MSKKSGLTLTMLIIYVMIISVIMGAVIWNLGSNDQIEELDKSTFQARIIDYISQFTTMKNYYTLKDEFNDEIIIKQDEKDIYGRDISDYISSITIEDKDFMCIYNGVLHFYNIDEDDPRYQYLTELGLTSI